MADEVEVSVETAPEAEVAAAESVAEVEAARAAASAEVAQEAAALAIVQAESTVADVAAVAATELEGYQERLALCEAQTAEATARLALLEAEHAEAMEHLSSIRSRLEATPEPHPESPVEEPPSGEGAQPEAEAPAEPERPERRRAHRWI